DNLTGGRPVPASRRMAADHGRDHVGADEAQPGTARSHPGHDLQLDAGDFHLHAGELPGWTGDLLGLEQLAVGLPTEHHHAQARRQDRVVRQYQGGVREEEAAAVAGGHDGAIAWPVSPACWMLRIPRNAWWDPPRGLLQPPRPFCRSASRNSTCTRVELRPDSRRQLFRIERAAVDERRTPPAQEGESENIEAG